MNEREEEEEELDHTNTIVGSSMTFSFETI
jgi:hypothetical protein